MKEKLIRINDFCTLNSKKIENDIQKSKYRITLILLYNKLCQIYKMNESIGIINTDVYSMSILQRSQIEHYLIFFYAVTQLEKKKDDFVGISYYFIYTQSEYLKQENYINKVSNIKNGTKFNYLDLLKIKFPNITQAEIDKVNSIGNVFSKLDVIAKRLMEYSNENESEKKKIIVNVELLEFYNILSSYVHGGPYADNELTFNLSTIDALKNRVDKIISISETLTYAAFYLFFKILNSETNNKYKNYS
ncbi:hypothetical protein FVB9288_02436 [Flavobacterium sp. CECT 9288]|uniref:hypothetical protein n=1 Tax=Flavobacterium sp. CECT 9288 TaxID=2845819 RepID=UPI001E3E3F0D|nr:hypothetical protein [Flavobacterium sp. CECT 9288]CAH0336723.1 hypothetical protein FVB9288_02436 [Flavobacterium sp. CECT 9288]